MFINDLCMTFIQRNVLPGTLLRMTGGNHATVIGPGYGGYTWVMDNAGKLQLIHHTDCSVLPLI